MPFKITAFILLLITVTLISCKEYPCSRAASQIALIGFPANETDTVIVRRFNKSTNFTSLQDSFVLNNGNSNYAQSNDSLTIYNAYGTDNGLTSDYDYEIFLPASGANYRITNIIEEFQSIRSGIFSMDKVGCENSIKSYDVNGNTETNSWPFFYLKK